MSTTLILVPSRERLDAIQESLEFQRETLDGFTAKADVRSEGAPEALAYFIVVWTVDHRGWLVGDEGGEHWFQLKSDNSTALESLIANEIEGNIRMYIPKEALRPPPPQSQ